MSREQRVYLGCAVALAALAALLGLGSSLTLSESLGGLLLGAGLVTLAASFACYGLLLLAVKDGAR